MNLGFEQAGEKPSKPKAWTVSGDGFATDAPGYEVGLDEAEAKSGKRSLKMKGTGQGRFGNAYVKIPADVAAGKHVKISGWIKTKDVAAKGYAGLWCRIDGTEVVLAHDNMAARIDAKGNVTVDNRGVRGTTDWKLYSVQHDVPSSARVIVFGALLTSEGTASGGTTSPSKSTASPTAEPGRPHAVISTDGTWFLLVQLACFESAVYRFVRKHETVAL